jgi:predicted nucleotide-binding protein (sugar kinase/HSP70/actin superfamily)
MALITTFEKRDMDASDRIAVTGRKFCNFVNLSPIVEPQAVEYAYQYCKPKDTDCPAAVSAGGETFMVYVLNRSGRRQGTKVLAPLIDLTEGLETARETFVKIGIEMGVGINKAYGAFETALKQQTECEDAMRMQGEKALQELEADPDKFDIVVFGRSYNAFTDLKEPLLQCVKQGVKKEFS